MRTGSLQNSRNRKQFLNFLRLIAGNREKGCALRDDNGSVTVRSDTGQLAVTRSFLKTVRRHGLVHIRSGRIFLSFEGGRAVEHLSKELSRAPAPGKGPQRGANHKRIAKHNPGESPVARLFRHRNKNGKTYLDEPEYLASEQLRRDFEMAGLQPRISAQYDYHAGSSGKGARFHAAELSDFKIDARRRVNDAIAVLGPNLSGVTLDTVCFLKGLETVEQERSWPPRSAKLMLKTALAKLAIHYGLARVDKEGNGNILDWNVEGYKPDISRR